MVTLRRAEDRRHERHAKLDVWLTFFSEDAAHPLANGFGCLKSLNEQEFHPGARSPHDSLQDSEIVTYVREGALTYEDELGSSGIIQAGEFLRMTSRRVHQHSETNPSRIDDAHIFQLRLRPLETQLAPSHEQKRFSKAERRRGLCVIASPDARRGSLRLHQDMLMYSAILDAGQHVIHPLAEGRSAWLHVVKGGVTLDDNILSRGDGAGITNERAVSFTASEATEVLLIDLAGVATGPFQ